VNRDAVQVPAGISPTGNGLPVRAADADTLGEPVGAVEGDAEPEVAATEEVGGADDAGVADPQPARIAVPRTTLSSLWVRTIVPPCAPILARGPTHGVSHQAAGGCVPYDTARHDRLSAPRPNCR
jgi:hypothetical protein